MKAIKGNIKFLYFLLAGMMAINVVMALNHGQSLVTIQELQDQIEKDEETINEIQINISDLNGQLNQSKAMTLTSMQEQEENATTVNIRNLEGTQEQYNMLYKLVAAEAGGQSFMCQLAVASVFVNRKVSNQFPDTIDGILNQQGQFSPVSNGSINNQEVTENIKKAVVMAQDSDYAEGALYFNNPDLTSDSKQSWFDTLPKIMEIDGVVFYG